MLSLLFVTLQAVDAPPAVPPINMVIADRVPSLATPFDLSQVQLLDSPFKQAQDLNHQGLLQMDLDLPLYPFRREAKLPSPVQGSDELGWQTTGHTLGHFLSASAMLYRNTGDPALKAKADAAVAVLAECQNRLGNGYLGGFPERSILNLEGLIRDPKVRATVPWYCLHKVYAGLLDMYVLAGNQQALTVLTQAADWIERNIAQLNDEQMQKMLGTEHGGMVELLANLSAATGQERYLKLAQRFHHHAVMNPFAKGEDPLDGLHANTQFPKFIGLAREYELTGDQSLHGIAASFWEVVVHARSYVTGGNSAREHFTKLAGLAQAFDNTSETCNAYNMLKLTRHLFGVQPQAMLADYYERTLYNQILSSRRPDGGQLYFQQLATGSDKRTTWKEDPVKIKGNSCCHGTGLESNAKYEDSIYFHQGDAVLYVNLFIPSVLNWPDQGLTLRQETTYPDQGGTKLVFNCQRPLPLTLQIRRPWWATEEFRILVNGTAQALTSVPSSYVAVMRTWQNGDTLEVVMPMSFRLEGFPLNPKRAAVMYGPLVMAAVTESGNKFSQIHASDDAFLDSLKPVPAKPLHFSAPASIFRLTKVPTADKSVLFLPLLRVVDESYAVYWDRVEASP